MIQFKVVVRNNRPDRSGLFNVEVLAAHQKTRIFFLTGFKVLKNQFRSGMIVNHAGADKINTAIQLQLSGYISNSIKGDVDISNLNTTQLRRLLSGESSKSVKFSYVAKKKIEYCQKTGASKSRDLYNYTLNTVEIFSPGITLKQITPKYLKALELHLLESGLKINTIAVLFRYIRIIFNSAIIDELLPDESYPFKKFKIKTEKTAKRSLSIREIRILSSIDHPAIDIFMLSFYLIGINVKDLLFATQDQLDAGRLKYSRFKTKRLYSIKVEQQALKLIEKHRGTVLLLGFMENRKRIDQFTKWINKNLRSEASKVGINKHITTYYARHSWATIAASLGVQKDTIAACLGHGGNTVTDIYIDFELSKVDKANRAVINALCL